MEEQAAPANNTTTQVSAGLKPEPKSKQGGKTGLLAAVLIIVVALLVGGFIFFRNNSDNNSTTPPAPVTQQDELNAGLEQIDQSLKEIDEDTESMNKLNPANDNDPNTY